MNSFYSEEELHCLGLRAYGKDVLISRKASIYGAGGLTIGDHVRIDDFCILSGEIHLHNYIHLAAGTMLFAGDAGITFEDYTTTSSNCRLYAVSDDYSGKTMTNPMIPEEYKALVRGPIILHRHVVIGTGCTLLPGVEVGEGASVGAMSLINRSLEPWGIYCGIPARKIRERQNDLLRLCEDFEKQAGVQN